MCQLLYRYTRPWDRCCGVLPIRRYSKQVVMIVLQPSPPADNSNAVALVHPLIFLPGALSISDLSQMFSVERSNAIFVAGVFIERVSMISVKP